VLFSAKDKAWKLADFGLATEGTSKRAYTTRYGRGTACYRAPELVKEHSEYNNKVDIFAMGCILFELITGGKKAFADDFAVREYSMAKTKFQLPIDILLDGVIRKTEVIDMVNSLLTRDYWARPSAADLGTVFKIPMALCGHSISEPVTS
jgi:serine/threonine protein kinase